METTSSSVVMHSLIPTAKEEHMNGALSLGRQSGAVAATSSKSHAKSSSPKEEHHSGSSAQAKLEWLPDETLLLILSFLSPGELLKRIAVLGHRWKCLALDDQLWKRHVLQHPNHALVVPLQQQNPDQFAADGKPYAISSWHAWYRELISLRGDFYRAVFGSSSRITGQFNFKPGDLVQVVGTQPRAGWVYAKKGRVSGFIESRLLEESCTIVTNSPSLYQLLSIPLVQNDSCTRKRRSVCG